MRVNLTITQPTEHDLTDALRVLDQLGISHRGPFVIQSGERIYVIDRYILLEEEILELCARDNLNRREIRRVHTGAGCSRGLQV